MISTPEGIQKTCGIEPGAGRVRDVPRILFAYKGKPAMPGPNGEVRANPDKFDYLTTRIAMIMAKAAPEAGESRYGLRAVTQDELAARCGLDRRETISRRIAKFTEGMVPDGAPYWCIVDHENDYKIKKLKRKSKAAAEAWCAVANAEAGSERYAVTERKSKKRNPRVLIERKRSGFSEPNEYHDVLPKSSTVWRVHDKHTGKDKHTYHLSPEKAAERAAELEKEFGSRDRFEVVKQTREGKPCYHPPTLQQLLADHEKSEWWDETIRHDNQIKPREGGWADSSHKGIFMWLWDERLMDPDNPRRRLGDIPRLVATYYLLSGLADFGEIKPYQDDVAYACGISPSEVYLANRKLARLGDGTVFRVVPQGGKMRKDGSGRWKPAKPTMILYLPIRTISHADMQAERERFSFQLATLQIHGRDIEAQMAHDRLADQYEGTERTWKTFYTQLHADLLSAGLIAWEITQLMPQQPPG